MVVSKQFIRATISSVLSALLDLFIFYLICNGSSKLKIIMIATIIARLVSAVVNFVLNKYWAFDNEKGRTKQEVISYFVLFVFKLLTSALLVWAFSFVKTNQTVVKMIIDVFLFFISYYIQDKFIFLTIDELSKKNNKKKRQ